MIKEEKEKVVVEYQKDKGYVLLITAMALLLNASIINTLIGLQVVDFVPPPEFLKWTNYSAFGAIAVILESYGKVRATVAKFLGNKFNIGK